MVFQISRSPQILLFELLGGPFGHAEKAIGRHRDDLLGAVQRCRGLGIPVNTVGILDREDARGLITKPPPFLTRLRNHITFDARLVSRWLGLFR